VFNSIVQTSLPPHPGLPERRFNRKGIKCQNLKRLRTARLDLDHRFGWQGPHQPYNVKNGIEFMQPGP